MTDPKAQADAIDPRTLADRLETQAMATARASQMLADDKTIRNRLAGDTDANYQGVSKVNTLEWQAAHTIRTLLSRIEELESAAALAGKIAIEQAIEACNAVYDRHAAAAQITPEFAWKAAADHCCDALRSLSKPLDRNALIERGARIIEPSMEQPRDGAARQVAAAVLSAWIGEETK